MYTGLLQLSPASPKKATPDVAAESSDSDQDTDDADNASGNALTDDKDRVEDNQLETFLSDPELSMKVFFSSHFRERGLIW